MMSAVRFALVAAFAGLCTPFTARAAAQNLVDLSWTPTTQALAIGDVVEARLIATSDGATGQALSGLDAIVDWDPALLELLGFDNTGAGYAWFISGFLPDPDGINLNLMDGDALFTALAQASLPAVAPPGTGLQVTKLRFKALAPTTGTVIRFTPALGQFGLTRVLDFFQPGLVITGDISSTLTVVVSSGPQIFCTSKPSSIAGCTPTLTATSATVSKSGAPANNMTAAPVPGGSLKPSILIFTKFGLNANPANTPFGFLCLNPFHRASAFPATPGGTMGTCTGSYSWNLATIAAGTPAGQMAAGDTLHIQAWYRDPGYPPPGNANFTNGFGPILVVP